MEQGKEMKTVEIEWCRPWQGRGTCERCAGIAILLEALPQRLNADYGQHGVAVRHRSIVLDTGPALTRQGVCGSAGYG